MGVKTVTQSRERRATAGKRMSSLVGKAQDDDEAFWNHDTWGDEHDEDYDVGEEKKEDIVDIFDSDFNDSEDESSDEDEGDEADVDNTRKRKRTSAGTGVSKKKSSRQNPRTKEPSQVAKKLLPNETLSPTSRIILTTIDPVLYPALYQRQQLLISQGRSRVSEAQKRDAEAIASAKSARSLMLKKKSKEKQKRSTFGTGPNAGLTLHVPGSADELQSSLDEWKELSKDYQEAITKRERLESHQVKGETNGDAGKLLGDTEEFESNQPHSTPSKNVASPMPSEINKEISTSYVTNPTPPISNIRQSSPTKETDTFIDEASLKARSLRTTTVQQSKATTAAVGQDSSPSKESNAGGKPGAPPKSDRKHIPTQEEMLMEAVHVTELENKKWLHTRQRQAAQDNNNTGYASRGVSGLLMGGLRADQRKRIIEKQHSKRGCLNTITFPDLDQIPVEWKNVMGLQKKRPHLSSKSRHGTNNTSVANEHPTLNKKEIPKCYITKQIAKYRDPKTGLYYANIKAFKEIRRQYDAGLLPCASSTSNDNTSNVMNGQTATSSSSKAARLNAASFKTLKVIVAGTLIAPPIFVRKVNTAPQTHTVTSFDQKGDSGGLLSGPYADVIQSNFVSAVPTSRSNYVKETCESRISTASSQLPSDIPPHDKKKWDTESNPLNK